MPLNPDTVENTGDLIRELVRLIEIYGDVIEAGAYTADLLNDVLQALIEADPATAKTFQDRYTAAGRMIGAAQRAHAKQGERIRELVTS